MAQPDGNGWVVVYEEDQWPLNLWTFIRLYVVDAGGGLSPAWTVDLSLTPLGNPDIGVDSDGSYLIVYQGEDLWSRSSVFGRIFRVGTGFSGATFPILSSSLFGADLTSPAINPRGYGGFLVTAQRHYSSSKVAIAAVCVAPDGTMPYAAYEIMSEGLNTALSVASGEAGKYVVTWQRQVDPNDFDVYWASCRSDSRVFYAGLTAGGDLEYHPTVAYSGLNGKYVIAWAQVANGAWQGNWNIYAQSVDTDGQVGSVETVADTSDSEGSPVGATKGGNLGQVFFAWDLGTKTLRGRMYSRNVPSTISVTTNRSEAPWTITGPATYTGTGNWSTASASAGTYQVTWDGVANCTTPATETKQLAPGGTISFDGAYSCGCGLATPSNLSPANGAIDQSVSVCLDWADVAGAHTLVMSLWKVPDDETRMLMEEFYRLVLAGKPRLEALSEARLAMKERCPGPLYWGAFICQGEPGPLQ